MIITANCYAQNSVIEPPVAKFLFDEFSVCLATYEKELSLQISKQLTAEELEKFKSKEPGTSEYRDIEKEMLPFKIKLTEVAQILEGFFCIYYASIPPKFRTNQIFVNLIAENEQEKLDLLSPKYTRGFGDVERRGGNHYNLDESIFGSIDKARTHSQALTFFASALRALKNNETEICFFLFFRIIDGYFADGSRNIETSLIKRASDLGVYLIETNELKDIIRSLLSEMNVPSKCDENFIGVIKDVVNIRHKLIHFSFKNARLHQSPTIKFQLIKLNQILYSFCFALLRDKIADNS